MNYDLLEFNDTDNIASLLNKKVKDCDKKYLVVKHTDLKIKTSLEDVVNKYIELINIFNLPFASYGFFKDSNRLFTGITNPSLEIKVDENFKLFLNRSSNNNGFIVFDIEKFKDLDIPIFDENIQINLLLLFTKKLEILDRYSYFGFIFDVYDTESMFENIKYSLNKEDYFEWMTKHKKEQSYIDELGIDLTFSPNIDNVLKEIKESYETYRK